jgi:cell shape-determining protein MreD
MFMPAVYSWLEPVIVMSAIVFFVGLIGNILSFESRFGNALTTALLFAILSAVLFFFMFRGQVPKTIAAPADLAWLEPVLIASAIVFIVDLIGNMLSFSNRFTNALVTSAVFALLFGGLSYFAYNNGSMPAAVPAATAPAAPATAPATP